MYECVCICLHAVTINERRGHGFKIEQGEVYRKGFKGGKRMEKCCNYNCPKQTTLPKESTKDC